MSKQISHRRSKAIAQLISRSADLIDHIDPIVLIDSVLIDSVLIDPVLIDPLSL